MLAHTSASPCRSARWDDEKRRPRNSGNINGSPRTRRLSASSWIGCAPDCPNSHSPGLARLARRGSATANAPSPASRRASEGVSAVELPQAVW